MRFSGNEGLDLLPHKWTKYYGLFLPCFIDFFFSIAGSVSLLAFSYEVGIEIFFHSLSFYMYVYTMTNVSTKEPPLIPCLLTHSCFTNWL